MADKTTDDAEEVLDRTSGAAPKSGEDILSIALEQFDALYPSLQEERAEALDDRLFVSKSGAQWYGAWGDQWANSIMVEVNKTAQGCEKISANYRANRMNVTFRPVGTSAANDAAEVLNGMYRADFYNSKGQQALDNAFEEGMQGGYGAWRLTNVYCDEYDDDDDRQKIVFQTIVDADQSVYWDPNARLYDKSDAMYCFVVTAMSPEAFRKQYGDSPVDWPDANWRRYFEWFRRDVVRVAEYYRIQETTDTVYTLEHAATGETRKEWAKDLEENGLKDLKIEGWKVVKTKKGAKRRECRKWVMSGAAILGSPEGKVIAGGNIPVIPYYGKRWYIDNMERARGHVRLAKDPQRIYNSQISKLVETSALSPIERPIFTPEQIAGHENDWANANIDRAAYSLLNAIENPDGSQMPAGPIGKIEPPQLPPVLAALIQQTANDIAELTNNDDTTAQVKSNVSAEAMDIAATRTDDKNAVYMDNMRQSVQRCGEIYLAMARDIYVEEGREVETMDDEDNHGTAVLQEPYTDDKGRFSIRNDIAKGKFKVIADVSEQTATRRDKTVKTLFNFSQMVMAANPQLGGIAASVALLNMDGEGINDLQEYVRSQLVQQGVVKPTPEEQAELEQAQANAQPPAQEQALMATAELALAQAGKAKADTEKSVADTKLSEAKTVETLAKAHATSAGVGRAETETSLKVDQNEMAKKSAQEAERKPGFMERIFGGKPKNQA